MVVSVVEVNEVVVVVVRVVEEVVEFVKDIVVEVEFAVSVKRVLESVDMAATTCRATAQRTAQSLDRWRGWMVLQV